MTDSPIHKTAMPSAFPAAGTFGVTQRITLRCATPGATIYYTLDESDPELSSPSFDAYQLLVTLTALALGLASIGVAVPAHAASKGGATGDVIRR
jgi:hypothetical protein